MGTFAAINIAWLIAVFAAIFLWEAYSQYQHRRKFDTTLRLEQLNGHAPDHACAINGISDHARAVAAEQAALHHCSLPAWVNTVIETCPDNVPHH